MSDAQRRPATSVVDLLDRVVCRGASVNGDAVVSLAWVELIRLDLSLLLTTADGEPHTPPSASARGTAS